MRHATECAPALGPAKRTAPETCGDRAADQHPGDVQGADELPELTTFGGGQVRRLSLRLAKERRGAVARVGGDGPPVIVDRSPDLRGGQGHAERAELS